MYKINFNQPVHIHFIGIGGISMSGLAELLHTKGFQVSGSDARKSKITEHLSKLGIEVVYGQRASNISSDIDVAVFTAAVKPDNPEYQAVVEHNIPLLDRAELLGQIMAHYKDAIGIAGTHGKTTTTSMLSLMLIEGMFDPTVSVGGILDNIEGNIRIGESEHFIVESCEYTNSFLKFYPVNEIILNIEADHLDFFKDINDVRHSFRLFAEKVPVHGNLIINSSIPDYKELIEDLKCNIITFGVNLDKNCNEENQSDYMACNVEYDKLGRGHYDLYKKGTLLDHIELGVIGVHNISNSVAAIALADTLGVSMQAIKSALKKFTGTERRFEYKGEVGGVKIFDDYAHHPTEIKATLTAAKRYPHKKLWCVFQPHTYTRTKSLLNEFAEALSECDNVILADIYAAREKNPGDISSRDLQKKIEESGKKAYYFPSFDEIENFLLQNCTNGDLLITMGAGDVVNIGESLIGK